MPLVARAAVAGGQMRADNESVVIDLLLAGGGLVAVKAVHALFGVRGHLVFVDNRVLEPRMTLGAFARRPHKVGGWLRGFDARPRSIDKKSSQNERKRDDDSDEHGTKRHAVPPGNLPSARAHDISPESRTLETVTGAPRNPHQRANTGRLIRNSCVRIDFEPHCD